MADGGSSEREEDSPRGRLIVVSNRIPKGNDVPAGGLVHAIDDALRRTGGLWIGAGEPTDEAGSELTKIGDGAYERHTFAITHEEHDRYYLGYSNAVLWPLFHHRSDLLRIYERDFEAYVQVNRRVARAIARIAEPDDLIWIQDYHFLMVAHELRALGVANRVGLFLHIPFPTASEVMALPQVAMLPAWVAAHDVFGVQTRRDVGSVREVLREDPKCQILNDGTWVREGRVFSVLAFPIGIDAESFARDAQNASLPRLTLQGNAPLLLGVDRLDYSKGLVDRFEAFGQYLEHRDPDSPKPTFLQIAPTSRGDVDAYRDIREKLDQTAGAINGRHSELDWTPLRYVNRHVDRTVIAGLYRRADVCLVTPLADGMNLVAKEFVAAQDHEDPGVLVLSHFAGAAEQFQQALMVNPFDHHAFALAIDRALRMPLEERRERHAALRENVFTETIGWWTDAFLARLARAPRALDQIMRSI
ncbi:trehalose-6-phosphate synthase [Jannaschia sp. W003]|uniref:alpha,alpha-trehalose-phosphate synthase (UDP-forming) n=1 Tax=Jannaschia sp. W003 TaxID=2867012 RepID=UPI0021A3FB29|nr:trehalose-6-phosphate synthase [Jannaschia sp. W003]UWQ21316.1 trehalose-6-phosphate synthase [Jannaschia sp. W003]